MGVPNALVVTVEQRSESALSRKVTIKELAGTLGVSVPTLRKYGECGLLSANAVSGRTNLFDEGSALARIEEINRLKSRGYSLALIREKLEDRPNGFTPLNAGLDGPDFTHGRHALLIVADMREYYEFARKFIRNGLNASQGVILIVHPDQREPMEAFLKEDGFDIQHLERRRQLMFTWYECLADFDMSREVDAFDVAVREMLKAGWQSARMLGHPHVEPSNADMRTILAYEERISAWARRLPLIVICPWIAPMADAQTLVQMQRGHKEIILGQNIYVKA